jgi:hypothetical protein
MRAAAGRGRPRSNCSAERALPVSSDCILTSSPALPSLYTASNPLIFQSSQPILLDCIGSPALFRVSRTSRAQVSSSPRSAFLAPGSAALLNPRVPRAAAAPSAAAARTPATIMASASVAVKEVATKPYDGQKTGTSGLRKRTKVFMQDNYLANWVQSLFSALGDEIKASRALIHILFDSKHMSP